MMSFSAMILGLTGYAAAVQLGDAVHDPIFAPIAPEHYMSAADLDEFAEHATAQLAAHETAVLQETAATNAALDALVAYYGEMGDTGSALADLGETLAQLGTGHANDLRVWWGNGSPEEPDTQDDADATEDDADVQEDEANATEVEADVQEDEAEVPVVEPCTKELNPPDYNRSYSSTYGNNATGENERSMLDSDSYWWSSTAEDQWIVIEAEQEEMITGVVMQGGNQPKKSAGIYYVTQVRLAHSTDGVTWVMANSGEARETGVQPDDGQGARYPVPFDAPVRARYVKIMPQEWNQWPCIRADLLVESPDYCE